MNLNKVTLAGRLTRDPEMRYTPTGLAVAKLGLAINREFTKNGEKKSETTFVDVDAFGKQAETIAQYLRKGSPIYCEGRLKLDQWDDKATGQKRSRLTVTMDSFQFVGKAEGQPATAQSESKAADTAASQASEQATEEGDSGVPF